MRASQVYLRTIFVVHPTVRWSLGAMGKEVIQGILLGFSAVLAVVLLGVFITLGDMVVLAGAGFSTFMAVGQWFLYSRDAKSIADA